MTPLAKGARENHNHRRPPSLAQTPGPASVTPSAFYNAFAATPKIVASGAGSRKKLKTSHEHEHERSPQPSPPPSPSRSQSQALPTRSQLVPDAHTSPTKSPRGSPRSKAGVSPAARHRLRMGGNKGKERTREKKESSPFRSSPSRVSRRTSSPTASSMDIDDEEPDADWEGDAEKETTDQRGEVCGHLFHNKGDADFGRFGCIGGYSFSTSYSITPHFHHTNRSFSHTPPNRHYTVSSPTTRPCNQILQTICT